MPAWIVWTLLTLVSWGIWAVLFRELGDGISAAHSQAISTLGILPVLGALWLTNDSRAADNRVWGTWLALGSGILSCLGNIACYKALGDAKAATVIPLTALYPVVTVLLAIPLLKERLNFQQWVGVALALAAIYLFNAPAESDTEAALSSRRILLPLAAIVLWGITGLLQKAATNHVSARSASLWFLAAFLPVAGLILLVDPLSGDIAPRTWILSTVMGFTLALGNFTLLRAFSSGGKVSIIAPLAGLYPLVSIPIALVRFHERLDWREGWFIVLALIAVVLLSLQSEPDSVTPTKVGTDVSL